ncbi:MAG: regulatory protein GemA [Dechloromonas sp.]|jgi:phage gp16-like protein|nr:regulatory protein GemA [Dechloromonas sp.]
MDAIRKSNLRAIIFALAGKKALGLTEDERRAIQMQVTGKASLSDMSALDMEDVVHHLRRLQNAQQSGTRPANPWAFVFRLPPEKQIPCRKIYRLAQRIGAAQKPPVGAMSKRYMEGIAERMLGADTVLEFCAPEILRKVVQALEIHCKRLGI